MQKSESSALINSLTVKLPLEIIVLLCRCANNFLKILNNSKLHLVKITDQKRFKLLCIS